MTRRTLIPAVLVAAAGSAANAQLMTWDSNLDGSWNVASNWSPANVPDQPGESALLSMAAAYVVTLNSSPAISELHITNNLASLHIPASRTLGIAGPTATNNGFINLNLQNSAANAVLHFNSNTVLSGTGEIRLFTNGDNSRLATSEGVVLTHGPLHTVRGVGWINGGLANQGTIAADVSIALSGNVIELVDQDKSNTGLIVATPGSQIEIKGITLDQTGGGELRAMDTGVVEASGSTIIGGTFEAEGTGAFSSIGSFSAEDFTINGASFINASHTLTVLGGGLVNNDSMHLNEQNSAANAILSFETSGELSGTGEVVLRTGADNSQIVTAPGMTVTHAPGHTITGAGWIEADLVNLGLIRADVSKALSNMVIELRSNDKVNQGAIAAAPGSSIRIDAISLDQSGEGGGVLMPEAGGVIEVTGNAAVIGGAIVGDGALTTLGNATLEDVLLMSDSFVNAGHVLTIAGSGVTNDGLMVLNNQNSAADAYLHFVEDSVLNGAGEIQLRTTTSNNRITTEPDVTVVHDAGHLIRGSGWIEASMINLGEIRADQSITLSGTTLSLRDNDKINDGVIVAAPGSEIAVNGVTVDQSGGGMLVAEDSGLVMLDTNALVRAGSFLASGSGAMTTDGSPALEDVTLDGPLFINAGHTLSVLGDALTNNGVITINNQNSAADAFLHYPASGSLAGTGVVQMRTNSSNSRVTSAEGATITHGGAHTIEGVGYIEASLINQGEIIADGSVALSGSELRLLNADKVNHGVMRAMPLSQLTISGVMVDQSGEGDAGSIEVMADGVVQMQEDALLVGGAIEGEGAMTTTGHASISGVTLNAASFVNAGHTLSVLGEVINNETLTVNVQNSAANAYLLFPEGGALHGEGAVILHANGTDAEISAGEGMIVTNGVNHTIGGTGLVSAQLVNAGRLAPGGGAGGPVETLDASGPVTFESTAVLAIDVNGNADRLTATEPVELDGAVEVMLLDGYVPGPCDSHVILSAPMIEGSFATLVAPDAGPGLRYRLFQDATTVQLRATCLADVNADCNLNILDFVSFQNLFQAGSSEADCNGDGNLNILDFVCFQNLFLTGCP